MSNKYSMWSQPITPESCTRKGDFRQLVLFQSKGRDLFYPVNCLEIAEKSLEYEKEHGFCRGRVDDLEKCVEYLRSLQITIKSTRKR